MKLTTTLLLLPFLVSAQLVVEDTTDLASDRIDLYTDALLQPDPTNFYNKTKRGLAYKLDFNPIEPERNGAKEPTACNTNGHTCNGAVLTNEICASKCQCDIPSGMIVCSAWSKCQEDTVEWNCQCHSADVPNKGHCTGFQGRFGGMQAKKDGKWPAMAPNKIKAHPIWEEVAAFKKRGLEARDFKAVDYAVDEMEGDEAAGSVVEEE